tara:strand:+ start:474 stop:926 length:453 start_codon:yes stop_codon:yes gene_type:complete
MSNKRRILLIVIFFISLIQVLLVINNSQKTSFKYFIWNIQEVKIGNLIGISFVTGLMISFILNKTIILKEENFYLKNDDKNNKDLEEFKSEENNNSKFEMPPQRDVRDPQPTISVNYRVIKNTEDNYYEYDKNSSNKKSQDDWDINDADW